MSADLLILVKNENVLLRNKKKYILDKDLSFGWDDVMTVITQQHSLCEKQKGKTFIHF